jgi:hypothetical protein
MPHFGLHHLGNYIVHTTLRTGNFICHCASTKCITSKNAFKSCHFIHYQSYSSLVLLRHALSYHPQNSRSHTTKKAHFYTLNYRHLLDYLTKSAGTSPKEVLVPFTYFIRPLAGQALFMFLREPFIYFGIVEDSTDV